MRVRAYLLSFGVLIFACGGDDGGGSGGDDAASGSDGGPIDATPEPDALVLTDCVEDLAPLADTSTANENDSNVVISEIVPGEFIEVYNSGDTAVMLSTTGFSWCNNHSYPRFTGHTIMVMPAGRRVINWPGGGGIETGGDVSIWSMPTFSSGSGANILDYVCWGDPANGGLTRKTEAGGVGKWTGACAPAIPPGGSLVRLPNTTGTTAADYATQATPTRENCE